MREENNLLYSVCAVCHEPTDLRFLIGTCSDCRKKIKGGDASCPSDTQPKQLSNAPVPVQSRDQAQDEGNCPRCGYNLAHGKHDNCEREHQSIVNNFIANSSGLAHEIWAAAQCAPGEGIEDAVGRIERLIQNSSEQEPDAWGAIERLNNMTDEEVMALVKEAKSDTPRSDAARIDNADLSDEGYGPSNVVPVEFARELERELNEANAKLSRLPADWFEDSSLETWFPFTAKELAELRKDKARLDWLETKIVQVNEEVPNGLRCLDLCSPRRKLRTFVDSAMKEEA